MSDTPYTCGDYVDIIIDHESDTSYTCDDYVDMALVVSQFYIIDDESDTPYTFGDYVDMALVIYSSEINISMIFPSEPHPE